MFRSYGILIGLVGLALVVGMGCSDDEGGGGAAGTGGTGGGTGGIGPVTKDVGLACNNSAQPQVSTIPATLTVDPGMVVAGSSFTATLTGNLNFPESFLDVATTVLPMGTVDTQIVALSATVEVRSGATGDNVALPVDPSLPTLCNLQRGACDASQNDANGMNPDCLNAPADTCGPILDLPLSTDPTTCEDLDKTSQLTNFGGCITGDLPLPLGTETGTYTAGDSGTEMLFGWLDDEGTAGAAFKECPDAANDECYSTTADCDLGSPSSPVCAYDGPFADGTNIYWSVPQPLFPDPIGPSGLKVNAGLLVAIECVMGADISRAECEGLCEGGDNDGDPCPGGDDECPGGTCGDADPSCGCLNDECGAILGATPDADLISFTIP